MNINLDNKDLSKNEKQAVENLLKRKKPNLNDDLEQIWYLMDLVWDDMGCNNKNLNWDNIGNFYSHPVWLLNGLFIEQDVVSMGHRSAISDWVAKKKLNKIVDYGGGFGTLAKLIAQKRSKAKVHIYEPHPSQYGLKNIKMYKNIKMINKLDDGYDCLIAEDVLEHLPDPLRVLHEMVKTVKSEGYLVLVNCFEPVIKCHLPENFHLKYFFNFFTKMMGLKFIGVIKGSPAMVYQKQYSIKPNWKKINHVENIIKIISPMVKVPRPVLRFIAKFLQTK